MATQQQLVSWIVKEFPGITNMQPLHSNLVSISVDADSDADMAQTIYETLTEDDSHSDSIPDVDVDAMDWEAIAAVMSECGGIPLPSNDEDESEDEE
jgi:hypothetical protein